MTYQQTWHEIPISELFAYRSYYIQSEPMFSVEIVGKGYLRQEIMQQLEQWKQERKLNAQRH